VKESLKYPPVVLSGMQAKAVGDGFAKYVRQSQVPIWACAILPEHVHLVVGRCRMQIEKIVIQLKGAATRMLIERKLHPFDHLKEPNGRPPKCFARGQWAPFLESVEDIDRAIRYVEQNPAKDGKPLQKWSFVSAFAPTS